MSLMQLDEVTVVDAGRFLPVIEPPRRGPKPKYNLIDVIQLLADGITVIQVAHKYGVLPGTIRQALNHFMRINKVRTISQLVAHSVRNGWVD
jgi:DNA-binding CsgD family transcriptional regulator